MLYILRPENATKASSSKRERESPRAKGAKLLGDEHLVVVVVVVAYTGMRRADK